MKIKRLHKDAVIPTRADSGSNGYDLYAVEDVFIPVGETRVIPTGISIELSGTINWASGPIWIPVFKIEDRSSMAVKGLRTGAGVVDNSYRGEIKVVMHNLNNKKDEKCIIYGGENGYKIKKGDKIAQGLIYYTLTPEFEEVNELEDTERGDSGFGSSGK